MLRKILRGLFTLTGMVIGYLVANKLILTDVFKNLKMNVSLKTVLFYSFSIIIFGLILFLISPLINHLINKMLSYFERNMQRFSTNEIVCGTLGAILGLIISSLIGTMIPKSPLGTMVSIILALILAVLFADIAIKKRDELTATFYSIKKSSFTKEKEKKNKNSSNEHKGSPKVLDTSVIIDGRIFDLCQTGFIEGTLIIPNFVLQELRHIADSSDSLKRNRGRRGLDVLNKIQNELNIEVINTDKDFPDIAEVDSKLLKLAQELGGKVITNDYNLNKVAEFQRVPVLNINELANAIKPVVLPGEDMNIQIVKDGKESNQGVAYLDDGTMIVVEGGRKHIGETIDVTVTSVLQTAAGRMIFAKEREAAEG